MIRIVPMTLEHLHRLKESEDVLGHYDVNNYGMHLIKIGVGFAMVRDEDGAVLGCGGVIPRWNGVGELWVAVSDELRHRQLLLLRHSLKIINMIWSKGKFHRLDMHVESGNHQLKRWAEALGFTYEGTMLKYGADGKNHDMYSFT